MTKTKVMTIAGVLLTTQQAWCDWSLSLLHVSENSDTGVPSGFGPSTTWQVWAHFADPTDIMGVLGKPVQPMFLQMVAGSIFNQISTYGQHQNFPPTFPQWNAHPTAWPLDTFVTIGKQTSKSPLDQDPDLVFTAGFTDLINNLTGSWNTNDLPGQEGGWIALDMPDFAHGTDLLLMQLTVSQGALFELVFGLDTLQHGYLHDWNGISFDTHGTTGSGASYLTNIPTPGTLVLLALTAVPVTRNRRRS